MTLSHCRFGRTIGAIITGKLTSQSKITYSLSINFFKLDVTTSGSYDFRQRTNQLVGARSTPETSTTGPPLTVLLVQSPSDWLEMRYKKASSFVRNYRSSAAKRSVRLKRVGSHWLANRRGLSRAIQENLAEPPCRQA